MRLVHKYLTHYFGTATYELLDEKVQYSYKNLKSDAYWDYHYSIIKSFRNHKKSSGFWGQAIWAICIIIIFFTIFNDGIKDPFVNIFVLSFLFILLVICFFLQFKKLEYTGFYDKESEFLFSIRLDKDQKTIDFIEELKIKVK